MKNVVRIIVNDYRDRSEIVKALANSGYKVWVKEEKTGGIFSSTRFVVMFENQRAVKTTEE